MTLEATFFPLSTHRNYKMDLFTSFQMENGHSFSSFEAFDMNGKNGLMLKKVFCLETIIFLELIILFDVL